MEVLEQHDEEPIFIDFKIMNLSMCKMMFIILIEKVLDLVDNYYDYYLQVTAIIIVTLMTNSYIIIIIGKKHMMATQIEVAIRGELKIVVTFAITRIKGMNFTVVIDVLAKNLDNYCGITINFIILKMIIEVGEVIKSITTLVNYCLQELIAHAIR